MSHVSDNQALQNIVDIWFASVLDMIDSACSSRRPPRTWAGYPLIGPVMPMFVLEDLTEVLWASGMPLGIDLVTPP